MTFFTTTWNCRPKDVLELLDSFVRCSLVRVERDNSKYFLHDLVRDIRDRKVQGRTAWTGSSQKDKEELEQAAISVLEMRTVYNGVPLLKRKVILMQRQHKALQMLGDLQKKESS